MIGCPGWSQTLVSCMPGSNTTTYLIQVLSDWRRLLITCLLVGGYGAIPALWLAPTPPALASHWPGGAASARPHVGSSPAPARNCMQHPGGRPVRWGWSLANSSLLALWRWYHQQMQLVLWLPSPPYKLGTASYSSTVSWSVAIWNSSAVRLTFPYLYL